MKRKRAMYQMKEQDKTPEKQLNEVEISNLPEKEFRIMIVKMIQDLGKRMEAKIEKMQKMFNKDLKELKNKQTEVNNTITEMKNTVEGINSRITEAEERISVLEYKILEITTTEQSKEKGMKRIEDSLGDFGDNIKRTNIRIIGVSEEEEKKKGIDKIVEEILVENVPHMGKDIVNQVREAQRVRYSINPRRNTPRHILIKLTKSKFKDKILKASEKQK